MRAILILWVIVLIWGVSIGWFWGPRVGGLAAAAMYLSIGCWLAYLCTGPWRLIVFWGAGVSDWLMAWLNL